MEGTIEGVVALLLSFQLQGIRTVDGVLREAGRVI